MSEQHVQHLHREVLGLKSVLSSNELGVGKRSVDTYTFLNHLSKASSEYFAVQERELSTGDLFIQLGERFLSSGQNGVYMYTYTSEDAYCIQILQTQEVLDEVGYPNFLTVNEFQKYQGNAVMFAYDMHRKSPYLQAIVPDEQTYSGQWHNRGFWIPERFERLTDDQKIMMGAQLFRVASRCGGLSLGMKGFMREPSPQLVKELNFTSFVIDTSELADDLSSQIGDILLVRSISPGDPSDNHTQYCVESKGVRRIGRVIWDGDIAIVVNYKNQEILRVYKEHLRIIGRFAMKISKID